MKKISLLFALLAINLCVYAQSQFVGDWEGEVAAGKKMLRLVFHIKQGGDSLSTTMDSPDQGVVGIDCQHTVYGKDSIIVDMSNIGIVYEGKLVNGNINGIWHQGGQNVAIEFKKTTKKAEMDRPQTPKPPFSYESEDVVYYNQDKSMQFGATITRPKGAGQFPAILLITGSGQQNRDEELYGHKPFAVIADFLTQRGYLVMRVDDRGIGQTTGDVLNATTADFATDVQQGVNYLLTRKDVNPKRLVLMGHSEGAIIAPMVAAKRKDIYAIVMMAGAGVPIPSLMEEQSAAILESESPNRGMIDQYKKLYRGMEDALLAAKDSNDARAKVTFVMEDWVKKTVPDMVTAAGLSDPKEREAYINSFVSIYNNKWFYYFLHINPMEYLEKLSCKVLAINGDKDVQVISKSNLQGIRVALAKSKSKVRDVRELPGLNHLFQECHTCTSSEYGELTETISPSALAVIGEWLDKNVRYAK